MTGPTTRRIEVEPGLELHTLVFGPDPDDTDEAPFVLAHGLASNARQWDGVSAELARLGHPVLAVDQRGHGLSDKPDDGFDLPTVAEDLARLIEIVGFERPVVAGQSWGGNVVVELAAATDALRGIACVDGGMIDLRTRFPDWGDAAEVMAPPRSAGTPFFQIEEFMRAAHPDWPEVGILGTLACFEQRADGTAAPWLTFERHMTVLRGLWEHDPIARYPLIDVPVMFVPADGPAARWAHDKRSTVEAAAALIDRVRVEWMRGDHDLHAQHPVELANLFHRATREFWR